LRARIGAAASRIGLPETDGARRLAFANVGDHAFALRVEFCVRTLARIRLLLLRGLLLRLLLLGLLRRLLGRLLRLLRLGLLGLLLRLLGLLLRLLLTRLLRLPRLSRRIRSLAFRSFTGLARAAGDPLHFGFGTLKRADVRLDLLFARLLCELSFGLRRRIAYIFAAGWRGTALFLLRFTLSLSVGVLACGL
jgi:hypothetical protein